MDWFARTRLAQGARATPLRRLTQHSQGALYHPLRASARSDRAVSFNQVEISYKRRSPRQIQDPRIDIASLAMSKHTSLSHHTSTTLDGIG